ncbi:MULTISPECIES: type I methionyl aminopeptidase [Aliarcobacter]|jgi:methionyl aminopeptidase|uniref:Methionine aminopeptidase n=5 Tax=Arcobacteraceae TaxID=2808963 RepID=A0A1V9VD23_9BACT|nr:type I methionyl aminopeptidase [Aliarcobacter cryaerophilus]OQA75826.1 MAG: Methionine aminopeptidase 1 [Candidatus Dependentiae bacterium ADurb.Bin246]WNL11693.1 type I methionyl aminopeptidase [Arcobacter sp. AZ-2023]WPD05310.1 type I methionyl aminopeptidase [Arcobacter sp. DSM 115956]WPD07404.1 type I methionyl aminopeptidase [Arcobacter sp. DSM 115955]WPD10305.1 type I methionyl aminopeptidase [Arcobacter sp. DSM 115954]
MSIALRKPEEIEKLFVANQAVAKTLKYLEENVKAGMTLKEVDAMGEKFILSLGARPAFKGLYGFPNAVCTSLNEVIIHGIPSDTVLKEGDILGLDIGTEVDGWYGDSAITMPIGDISKKDEELIACAKDALYYAIDIIEDGMRFKELSKAIEDFITSRGYQPLVRFCGHGIGRKPHEEPEIPNYLEHGGTKSGPKIKNGMVFCIEPMICQKDRNPVILKNGWDVVSADGLRGSHYEHTVAVVDGRAVILSNREN